jgi:hypothetical protein
MALLKVKNFKSRVSAEETRSADVGVRGAHRGWRLSPRRRVGSAPGAVAPERLADP